MWSPHVAPDAAALLALQIENSLRKVVVAGINYWEGPRGFDGGYTGNYTIVPDLLAPILSYAKLIWYTTPEMNEVSRLLQHAAPVKAADFAERNMFFRDWIRSTSGQVLPGDRIEQRHILFLNQEDSSAFTFFGRHIILC